MSAYLSVLGSQHDIDWRLLLTILGGMSLVCLLAIMGHFDDFVITNVRAFEAKGIIGSETGSMGMRKMTDTGLTISFA